MLNSIFDSRVLVCIPLGIALGYLLSLLLDSLRRSRADRERNVVLERTRLEAEALKRDARLAANEEALKARTEIEQVAAARQKELAVTEHRLITREELVNGQLAHLVQEEKVLRADRDALAAKTTEAEALRKLAEQLVARRRAEL